MEITTHQNPYLIIKIRTESPQQYSMIKGLLPLANSRYDRKYKLLSLAFPAQDIENRLGSFIRFFPKADIVETSLSSSPAQTGYVKRFSENLAIVCPDGNIQVREDDIVIRSTLSFGSGFHPTTEICMALLEHAFTTSNIVDVFDLGTGSGILALAACRLGAKRVLAADIDFQACVEALDNVRLNGAENRICIVNGSYSCAKASRFDLLLANLTISTILTLGQYLAPLLKLGGTMILSGFTREQIREVEKSIGPVKVLKSLYREGWAGILAVTTS